MTAPLPAIPVVDCRDGGPVRRAAEARERARALRDECVAWLPRLGAASLPMMDAITRRWLKRSCSPYVNEVTTIATGLAYPGIWFLNGCYQWGCTSLAREQDGAPWLVRTLDWPFPGLGRHLEVARMRGAAGDYYNVGWPGYVGALTAMAPGRFAAVINQAPLWRRTRRPWLRPYDLARNALRTWRIRHIPPDHLMRQVFETCRTFGEARHRLETTPVARPVIYTLAGCEHRECCVIERTEEGFLTRTEHTAAANDWRDPTPSWEARTRADLMLTISFEETAERSRARCEHLRQWPGRFAGTSFAWVAPPILNPYTRLAVEMCPATSVLRAIGYERTPDTDLPQAATLPCEISAAASETERASASV